MDKTVVELFVVPHKSNETWLIRDRIGNVYGRHGGKLAKSLYQMKLRAVEHIKLPDRHAFLQYPGLKKWYCKNLNNLTIIRTYDKR